MPTYQYHCKKCNYLFDVFKRMKEVKGQEDELCPECGERAKRIIIGGTGFVLKGDGFYINDYKKKENKK